MVKDALKPVIVDPVSVLAQNYAYDLKILRNLNPSAITPLEIKTLYSLTLKYKLELENKVDKNNFFEVKGQLQAAIQERLENLAIEDVLESERERTPSKKRREQKVRKQKIPKIFEE